MMVDFNIVCKNVGIISPNGDGLISGKWIVLADNQRGWLVQDISDEQNTEIFKKGLKIIFEMDGKRGDFLKTFVMQMANTFSEVQPKCGEESYCNFIAFVCDIAQHKKLKNWEGVYHKAFPKFVGNLCWNYYLDGDWELYKKGKDPIFARYCSVFV